MYMCTYVDIRRPLQSVERVRLHLLAPKQAASQQGSQPARQQGSKAARIWQLTPGSGS